MKSLEEVGARYAYAQGRGLGRQCPCIILNRQIRTACVLRIVASDDLKHQSCVHRRARHGAYMVEGPGEGYNPPCAHASICGFESNDAAVGCRHADGASGIGTNGSVAEFRRDSCRGPAGRAAWAISGVPGVMNWAKIADYGTATIGELVQVKHT